MRHRDLVNASSAGTKPSTIASMTGGAVFLGSLVVSFGALAGAEVSFASPSGDGEGSFDSSTAGGIL
jgi:hypothetical protein